MTGCSSGAVEDTKRAGGRVPVDDGISLQACYAGSPFSVNVVIFDGGNGISGKRGNPPGV